MSFFVRLHRNAFMYVVAQNSSLKLGQWPTYHYVNFLSTDGAAE